MNAESTDRMVPSDDPAAIARRVNRTRVELGETLDELQERLSPRYFVEQMVDYARDNVGEFAVNFGSAVKRKPLPVLLTGIGLLWTMVASEADGGARGRDGISQRDGIRERGGISEAASRGAQAARSAGESVSEAAGSVSDAAGAVRDKLAHAARRASESVSSASDRMRELAGGDGLSNAGLVTGFQKLLEEQPLTLGALGLALGALVGAALPATESEDRWLGEASERTREQAAKAAKAMASEQPACGPPTGT